MGRSSALVGAKKSASERKDTISVRVMYFPCSRCFRFAAGATLYDLNSNSITGAGIKEPLPFILESAHDVNISKWSRRDAHGGGELMRKLPGSASRLPSAGPTISRVEGA